MKIYVCVKHVPDTAASITVNSQTTIDTSMLKFVVNPYDEYAIEEAVSLVEKKGPGEVVLVCVGPEKAAATLQSGLAAGADRGILVVTEVPFPGSAATAKALQAAIEQDGRPDLIFAGKTAVDSEGNQTLYRLAANMDLPVASDVSSLDIAGGTAVAERDIGGNALQVIEMDLPCVIGAARGLNQPRYPKFPDIMKAKKKKITKIPLADLGVDLSIPANNLESLENAPERAKAEIIQGSSAKACAEQLVHILEAKKVLN
ncbi:MAG TPA: electron transfer flavoprotein subunit beta/FixA family protein [Desulfobacteraceae bacterium]|nr:electron transfer flavoprotein subunit beta/FixA family protein [Desulfobacteraceae bacterium]